MDPLTLLLGTAVFFGILGVILFAMFVWTEPLLTLGLAAFVGFIYLLGSVAERWI